TAHRIAAGMRARGSRRWGPADPAVARKTSNDQLRLKPPDWRPAMSCSRRDFLTTSTLALGAGMLLHQRGPLLAWQQQPAPLNPLSTPIRRNIGFFTCRGGTIGYLINKDGVVAVDSQYPDAAALCVAGLKSQSNGRGVDLLINTHHHADHTGGN